MNHPEPGGERVDVVVLGGGPAGATAALILARNGASVLLVDRCSGRQPLGESLPPAATPLLRDLGLWDRFLADRHLAAYGNRSVWGTVAADEYDFIRDPHGIGRHLDRQRFDAMLTAAAEEAGAVHLKGTRAVEGRRVQGKGWRLTLTSGANRWPVGTGFVVDATGRARWLARLQRMGRVTYDRLIGVVALLVPAASGTDRDSLTLVEAAREGWWYAALLPDGRLAVAHMTDADLATGSRIRTAAGWLERLGETAHIAARVATYGYRLEGGPRVVCADSSRLRGVGGDGWCAVGDAAAAFDPLSSQGIVTALAAGLQAAQAIEAGSKQAFAAYEEWMERVYARYLAQWLAYYALEQRWPTSLFWARRHSLLMDLMAG